MKINWPDSIDETVFLQHYWQQKPLLIENAFPDFDNPLDPDELAGLACDPDSSSRFMQQVKNNEWRMCMGPLSDDFFDDINNTTWSLLVSDVEKLLPDFRYYLQPFQFIPNWRIDDLMISYAPVGGSVGAHVDQYDVFLLQASGVREWQIETTQRKGQQKSVSTEVSLLGDFNADQTMQLAAGDMLYLPPQFAHHGIAKADPCMTWSIGFRAPSIDEMLPSILNYLIDENQQTLQRFADAERRLTLEPGAISAEDLGRLRNMLRDAIAFDDSTLERWIGRYLTEAKIPADDIEVNSASWAEMRKQLSSKTLVCNSHQHFIYRQDNGHTDLFADGQHYRCSIELAKKICNARLLKLSDIHTTEDRNTVTRLYNRQCLLPDVPG